MGKIHVHVHKRTGDAKPATDSERRERIQRVMSAAGVTEATARNMLEGEEWDVGDAVRELKHMRTLGFVIDSVRDGKVLYVKV